MNSVAAVESPASVRQALQARISSMQSTRLDDDAFPVLPKMRGVLARGLRRGTVYSLTGSTSLALALVAAASQQGEWCGVLDVPDLGLEAAAGWGIDLDRLVWVSDPGERWMSTVGAMADVLGLVIVRPPTRVSASESSRLSARLRQARSTMLVLGDWPQSESEITVVSSSWTGLGDGHGHLADRRLDVEVRQGQRAGAPRRSQLRIPAGTIR
ncbi:hypothetical protein [Agreia sp. Leaf283]|uniref:hypothetical protein n=1 Tax=Agreia sp. Leaf283 TaxID=1736321 RepID=UPI000728C74A|nr:hypothetical protein [Agreia sp. Leaf283]KQP57880.1 hypothetical protein ASF51_08875 [Agreia sp. Leaf283]